VMPSGLLEISVWVGAEAAASNRKREQEAAPTPANGPGNL